MKKINLLFFVLMIGGLMVSCGSKKELASKDPASTVTNDKIGGNRVKIENDKCEEKANEASEFLRAYGMAKDADKMFARNIAEAEARAGLVKQIEVAAASTLDKNDVRYRDGNNTTSSGKAVSFIKEIAAESLKGARIICSNTYDVNGEYEVHVCIELTGQNFVEKTYNKIAKEEKLVVDYNYDKYKKDFEKALDDYKKSKQ